MYSFSRKANIGKFKNSTAERTVSMKSKCSKALRLTAILAFSVFTFLLVMFLWCMFTAKPNIYLGNGIWLISRSDPISEGFGIRPNLIKITTEEEGELQEMLNECWQRLPPKASPIIWGNRWLKMASPARRKSIHNDNHGGWIFEGPDWIPDTYYVVAVDREEREKQQPKVTSK